MWRIYDFCVALCRWNVGRSQGKVKGFLRRKCQEDKPDFKVGTSYWEQADRAADLGPREVQERTFVNAAINMDEVTEQL